MESSEGFAHQSGEGLVLPPWEEMGRYGFLNAFYLTVRRVLFTPGRLFGRMPSRVGIWQPLLFALVAGMIGAFFQWMWSLTGATARLFLSEDVAGVMERPFTLGIIFVLSPLLVCVQVFMEAGIIHLCLMITGGDRLGFEATFRVTAYAMATALLLAVPFCGNLLFLGWGVAVLIIGLARIHGSEPWRAALAVLLPTLVCGFGCVGIGLLTMSLIATL
jgi:hypothetical protein